MSIIAPDAFDVIARALLHPADGVKQAAAWSMGAVTTGNLPLFLPLLLQSIEAEPALQYLTLTALLTAVQLSPPAALTPHVDTVTPLLFRSAESGEEGVRATVSECLGGLTLMDPERLIPQLVERVGHSEPKVREVIITALRHSVPSTHSVGLSPTPPLTEGSAALQVVGLLSILSSTLPAFFPLLSDSALPVQKQALLTVTSLTHSQPSLLQPHLPALLPLLYPTLTPVPAHVRVVDLGPFKHRVDDGLPLRQAAFTALSTIFSSCHVGEEEVREWVRRGVRGAMGGAVGEGVGALVWEEVERLAGRYERVMVGEVDGMVGDMMKSIREQLKAAKEGGGEGVAGQGGAGAVTGSEGASRARDILRICVRALLALQKMRGVEGHAAFQEFYARVLKTQMLVVLMQEMKLS